MVIFSSQALSTTKPFKSFPDFTTRNITSLISTSTLFPEGDSTDRCSISKMTTYSYSLFHTQTNYPFTPLQVYFLKNFWCGSLSINLSVQNTPRPTLHQPVLFVCPTTLLQSSTSHILHDLPLQKVCQLYPHYMYPCIY